MGKFLQLVPGNIKNVIHVLKLSCSILQSFIDTVILLHVRRVYLCVENMLTGV